MNNNEPTTAETLALLRTARAIYADHGGHSGTFLSADRLHVCANGAICEALGIPMDREMRFGDSGGFNPSDPSEYTKAPATRAVIRAMNFPDGFRLADFNDEQVRVGGGVPAILARFDEAIARLENVLGKPDVTLHTTNKDSMRSLFALIDEVQRP